MAEYSFEINPHRRIHSEAVAGWWPARRLHVSSEVGGLVTISEMDEVERYAAARAAMLRGYLGESTDPFKRRGVDTRMNRHKILDAIKHDGVWQAPASLRSHTSIRIGLDGHRTLVRSIKRSSLWTSPEFNFRLAGMQVHDELAFPILYPHPVAPEVDLEAQAELARTANKMSTAIGEVAAPELLEAFKHVGEATPPLNQPV